MGICRDIYRGERLSLQVLDRDAACVVAHEEPYAVISITDPVHRHPELKSSAFLRGVLQLTFSDVDERFARLNVSTPYVVAFSPEMGQQVAAFVEEQFRSGVRLIVVHCQAGMSRSAGVACSLSRHYNGDDRFFYGQYRPNRWVREVLLAALQEPEPEPEPEPAPPK
ncbi:MAG: hypothetical protein ACK47B_16380 [Armatimonadota bacterium]